MPNGWVCIHTVRSTVPYHVIQWCISNGIILFCGMSLWTHKLACYKGNEKLIEVSIVNLVFYITTFNKYSDLYSFISGLLDQTENHTDCIANTCTMFQRNIFIRYKANVSVGPVHGNCLNRMAFY